MVLHVHTKMETHPELLLSKIEIRSFQPKLKYGAEYGAEQVCIRNTGKSCKIFIKYGAESKSYLSLWLNEMLKYKTFSKVN